MFFSSLLQNLVSLIQCQRVQFNDFPSVAEFEPDSARLPSADQPLASESNPMSGLAARAHKLSSGGVNDLFELAASIGAEGVLQAGCLSSPQLQLLTDADLEEEESSSNSTFILDSFCSTKPSSSTARGAEKGEALNSTFTMDTGDFANVSLAVADAEAAAETKAKADAGAEIKADAEAETEAAATAPTGDDKKNEENSSLLNNSLLLSVPEEGKADDSIFKSFSSSPQVTWRPATPPKRRRSDGKSPTSVAAAVAATTAAMAAEKENRMNDALKKVDEPAKKMTGSPNPLKPNNSEHVLGFYAPTK